ncbi:MAG: PBP1A family penicillin-binding protein [Proteobacteria bacterium]|nr:PBP1A family penicillin-binding protein [Cystobacterineae bacterium]MCL2258496.1 PBP1A family penicillin-binding protein [Cystobacterineae bacterium]MCL2315164.1 PBP1A family penicillin-binding protein [Pseudomonadota bacterium]
MRKKKTTSTFMKRVFQVPRRSWRRRIWNAFVFLSLTVVTAGVAGVAAVYIEFSPGIAEVPDVAGYHPPILTEVFSTEGVLVGEFYEERRKVIPYERIPKRLVQAFVASEDSAFFDHLGIDLVGTARAAYKTVLAKMLGSGSMQGGSTLTQQTAKAIMINAEGYKAATAKTLRRKIREAILAFRLEVALSKEEILYLYLNNVYLGHHSYGIQSAAENYFRKGVAELSLAQMALIAGLPQAPSKYSPFRNPENAKRRRGYVLRRMYEEGMIGEAERREAEEAPVEVHNVEDVFHEFAPYYTEEVRRYVVERWGNPALLKAGLKVFTAMDAEKQRIAQEAVLSELLSVDKRQGYRGPLKRAEGGQAQRELDEQVKKVLAGAPLKEGALYIGRVVAMAGNGQWAKVKIGEEEGLLPLSGMRWARKLNPDQYYPNALISKISAALRLDDVVVIRVVEPKRLFDGEPPAEVARAAEGTKAWLKLEQEPELQTALVSIDPHRRYVVAMVGGYDFDANEFNRAFQACRQPGSSFKPFVYAAALEQLKWTQATILVDSPIVYDDPENETRWKPANYGQNFVGDVTLRTAITLSMNIPAVKTFIAVGVKPMEEWNARFGFSTPLNADFSAALGSSCVKPIELANAYTIFGRGGLKTPSWMVRKIEDRFGRTLEDHTAYDDVWAPLTDRMAAGYAALFEEGERVLSKETAFLTTDLLRSVVREGTGAPAQALKKPAAGKTGTTNDSFDAWFAGFTQGLVTVVWVGYDKNEHPLGRYETGGRAALPLWLSYMKGALEGYPQPEFDPPPGLNLIRLRIDKNNGLLASSGTAPRDVAEMYFVKGTEPKQQTSARGEVDSHRFFMENP